MTEITSLLSEEVTKKFELMMYGKKGLYNMLPPGTIFDDVAIECICTLLILDLECNFDLDRIGKSKLFNLYTDAIDFIHSEQDVPLADGVYTKKGFFDFMDTYFPNWGWQNKQKKKG